MHTEKRQGNHYYAMVNCRLFGESDFLLSEKNNNTDLALIVRDSRIEAIVARKDVPADCSQIDLNALRVLPGYIDLQLNGCGGVLFGETLDAATLDTMHSTNLRTGCTAFLPTLVSSDDQTMAQAVEVVRHYRHRHPDRVPGLHLEGPYINPDRKGIHDARVLRQPTPTAIDFLCRNSDVIRMVTLAPEVCPPGMIETLCAHGIVVSVGHTDATCAQIQAAEQAGVRMATHLHNAMRPLTSREPGVVGAVLESQTLCAGIIADGYHLAWENLRLAHRLMQDRLLLVTDGTPASGTTLESFMLGGHRVYCQDGQCRNLDGTLGGSALTMEQAVINALACGLPADAVCRMATINPARAIGLETTMGQLAAGQFANLTLVDPDFKVQGTVSGGELLLLNA
ncbi:MAG: N-acetylglucosamine-6-phosphate deacetylase [Kistimonas sp.]|nr:N-acetylglucosamine-6-phosphate deacetylase [Kistimonas sp.]